MSFVVGQWVECVDDIHANAVLTAGQFYRVDNVASKQCVVIGGLAFGAARFRPVSWQVGNTYRTTLKGVTATITEVNGHAIRGVMSNRVGVDVWDTDGTGRLGGCNLENKTVPHLTPYLAYPEPSPAVETTEPSKATLCDSAAEIRELLSDMDSVWKEAETTSHPERLQHDEECPFVPVSRYHRTINGVTLDLYDIAEAYDITSHRIFHAVKKLVLAGRRGHKGREQDLREAIISIESELKKMKGGAS